MIGVYIRVHDVIGVYIRVHDVNGYVLECMM